MSTTTLRDGEIPDTVTQAIKVLACFLIATKTSRFSGKIELTGNDEILRTFEIKAKEVKSKK